MAQPVLLTLVGVCLIYRLSGTWSHQERSIMEHGGRIAIRVPAGVYGVLRAERLRLSDGRRYPARGAVSGDDGRGVRTEARLSHQESAAFACAARVAMHVPARRRLFDPSGEAHSMPDLSLLAGVTGEPAGMAA